MTFISLMNIEHLAVESPLGEILAKYLTRDQKPFYTVNHASFYISREFDVHVHTIMARKHNPAKRCLLWFLRNFITDIFDCHKYSNWSLVIGPVKWCVRCLAYSLQTLYKWDFQVYFFVLLHTSWMTWMRIRNVRYVFMSFTLNGFNGMVIEIYKADENHIRSQCQAYSHQLNLICIIWIYVSDDFLWQTTLSHL